VLGRVPLPKTLAADSLPRPNRPHDPNTHPKARTQLAECQELRLVLVDRLATLRTEAAAAPALAAHYYAAARRAGAVEDPVAFAIGAVTEELLESSRRLLAPHDPQRLRPLLVQLGDLVELFHLAMFETAVAGDAARVAVQGAVRLPLWMDMAGMGVVGLGAVVAKLLMRHKLREAASTQTCELLQGVVLRICVLLGRDWRGAL